jgi:glycerophosphoryl diester phosphodiesterase
MPSRIQAFEIVGQRGAPILAPPGNTATSLRKAVELGARMLEVDVRRTRDDVLVLNQNTACWVAGEETPLEALSYAQWRDYTYETDAPLASLQEAFHIASQHHVGLMLDFKEPGTESLLARAIRASGFPMAHLLVAGAPEPIRHRLSVLDPTIPLSLTFTSDDAPVIDAKLLAAIDTDAVTWHHRLLTAGIVKVLRLRSIRVYALDVNLLDDMKRMREVGVDGIMTDSPDLLRSLF